MAKHDGLVEIGTTQAYQEGLERGTTHNGWANRSTWLAVMWLAHDEGLEERLREIALSDSSDRKKEFDLYDYLYDLTIMGSMKSMHGLAEALIRQELCEVDYQAIISAAGKDGSL
tara:strand:+ start:1337 stop:1681 length:345 start_codon:yes stop_codon:yes gene_type:complete